MLVFPANLLCRILLFCHGMCASGPLTDAPLHTAHLLSIKATNTTIWPFGWVGLKLNGQEAISLQVTQHIRRLVDNRTRNLFQMFNLLLLVAEQGIRS
jgi:hypothetical protein